MFITYFAYLQFFITFSLIFFSYKILKSHNNRLSLIFGLMTITEALFSFGYGVELLAQNENLSFISLKFQYFGLSFLPIFWFIFAYRFYYNKYPKINMMFYSSIIPFITFFLVMTNEYHHLYYANVKFMSFRSYNPIILEKNWFYYIFISYNYLILISSFFAFLRCFTKNIGLARKRGEYMLLGSIFPPITNLLYLLKMTPYNLDFTGVGFFCMTYLFYIAIFKYSVIDLKEIVRYSSFDNINEGILVIDKEWKIIDVNSSAERILPFLTEELIGKNLNCISYGNEIIEKANLECFEIEIITHFNKKSSIEFKKSNVISNGQEVGIIFIFQDVTNQKELIQNLSFLATHDFLTGVCNRSNFLEIAQFELYKSSRYKEEFCILMIDIDFFKKINDNYGHLAGDLVLKEFVKIVKSRVRESDVFGRYGGEEFLILFPNTSPENGIKIANNIRRKVEKTPINIDNRDILITVSMGLTHYSHDMSQPSLNKIIETADNALYKSKINGRNRITFHKLKTDKE